MDKLTDDLRALILQKKAAAENMRLIFYNQSGLMFYVTRNMSAPPWHLQFYLPTPDTCRYIHARTYHGSTPFQPAKFLPPLLVRTEATLEHLVKNKVSAPIAPHHNWAITYIYEQGTDAPPHFADTGSCATEPDDNAKLNELREWYKNSYHHSVNYDFEEDEPDEVKEAVEQQTADIMNAIKVLIGEF